MTAKNLLACCFPITRDELLPLLDPATIPTHTMFSFVAVLAPDQVSFRESIDLATDVSIDRLTYQFQYEEKMNKAPEKKRPWHFPKTRFPFEGKLKHAASKKSLRVRVKKLYDIMLRIIRHGPTPIELLPRRGRNGAGRPRTYDWFRIVAAIAVTFYLYGSVGATADVIEIFKINVTVNHQKRVPPAHPSRDEIYKVYQAIPVWYMLWLLVKTDEVARKRALRDLGIFATIGGVDGSAEKKHYKEVALVSGRERLMTATIKYTVFVRFFTNTTVFMTLGYVRDLNEYFEFLHEQGIYYLTADAYFRIAANQYGAEGAEMKFITRGKRGSKQWPFSRDYGIRKLTERVFGGVWMERKKRLFGKNDDVSLYKKLVLVHIGHNLRQYERISLMGELFVRSEELEEAYAEI